MSKHYQFESVYSLTGANADYRAQIKPSHEGITASSILSVLKKGSFIVVQSPKSRNLLIPKNLEIFPFRFQTLDQPNVLKRDGYV